MYKLYILFAQRKCGFPGEYAVEALEVVDEYVHEGNPDWLDEKKKEHEDTKEFETLKILSINIDEKKLNKIMMDNFEFDGKIDEI